MGLECVQLTEKVVKENLDYYTDGYICQNLSNDADRIC